MTSTRTDSRSRARGFNGVKVFSATLSFQRQHLGDVVTRWIAERPAFQVDDIVVTQSSDISHHCLAITIFYREPISADAPPRKELRGVH
jgi:hypothetical protein